MTQMNSFVPNGQLGEDEERLLRRFATLRPFGSAQGRQAQGEVAPRNDRFGAFFQRALNTHRRPSHRVFLSVLLTVLLFGGSGCVYFNTFYNARKAFNSAEKTRKASGSANINEYETAIAKCLKIVDNYPKSKYYDDAVYVLAISYYHTSKFDKSERRLRELLANYPNSKYTQEATVYLAQTRLKLGETAEAMAGFEEIFRSDFPKQHKAQAATELATYYTGEKQYDLANSYYRAVRDSLGDLAQQRAAQRQIAEGLYANYQFGDALGAYLQILGLKPAKNEEYHALYFAADCAFKLVRVSDGLEYLKRLADNELFFDSLGVLNLKMAEGYELEGEMTRAQGVYGDVAATSNNKVWVTEAYYRLGLIFQFDYDDLEEAKFYYDKATKAGRASGKQTDALNGALQRSADISMVSVFQRPEAKEGDTTVITQAMIDDAALKQFQLGLLYWHQLDKPDSAIADMKLVVDSFPNTRIAPKAMLALSQMIREQNADTASADSIARLIPLRYHKSDYLPEIFEALGLNGTGADTGYAEIYVKRAEDFWVDSGQIDSARYWYQYVVDSFPESAHCDRARFATIWLTEKYQSPGDSSIFFAYKTFADSFPKSVFAADALQKLSGPRQAEAEPRVGEEKDSASAFAQHQPEDSTAVVEGSDTSTTLPATNDPQYAYYFRGDTTLTLLSLQPIRTEEPFEFPQEAYNIEGNVFILYFQLHLDFSGKVDDFILKTPSGNDEIDRRANKHVLTSTFNPQQIRGEFQGSWFVWKFVVQKPEHLIR
jgi:TolA-binding protein